MRAHSIVEYQLDDHFFLNLFTAFYEHIFEIKQQVAQKQNIDDEHTGYIIDDIYQFLLDQEHNVSRSTNAAIFNIYKDMQYLMIGLADEIFLHLEWSGSEYWSQKLLEHRVFGTHISGEKFFTKLDELLSAQNNLSASVHRYPLLNIYLYCLALGFNGKYHLETDQTKAHQDIMQYKKNILQLIHSNTNESNLENLFPETSLHTMIDNTILSKRQVFFWSKVILVICGSFILISGILWHFHVHRVNRIAKAIIQNTNEFHHE